MFDARSAREDRAWGAAAFLTHSQTKSMSARSFVQDSGARSWARVGSAAVVVPSQRKERLRSQLLRAAARDFPTLAAQPLLDFSWLASSSAEVTGSRHTKWRHTYAVGWSLIIGRSASSARPGWSGTPAITTDPAGASW